MGVSLSGGLAALLRIGFRCWPLAARVSKRGALVGPPLALPARPPAVRRVRRSEPLPLVAAGPVLAPPSCASFLGVNKQPSAPAAGAAHPIVRPELTFVQQNARSRPVLPARKFLTALFALALWLGATQHCNLEAAGILASHTDAVSEGGCCTGSDVGCASDGCESVENGAYRTASENVAVDAPAFVCCQCLICLSLDFSPVEVVKISGARTDLERPLDWVPTWQFVQRAALSPRAPSLMVA